MADEDVYQAAMEFRKKLLKRDKQTHAEIVALYAQVLNKMSPFLSDYYARRRAGEPLGVAEGEKVILLERLQKEIGAITAPLASTTKRAQADAFDLANSQAFALAELGAPNPTEIRANWRRPSFEAFANLVGYSGDGRPLDVYFQSKLPSHAAKEVQDALRLSTLLNESPAVAKKRLKGAVAGNAWRAETIARTETLRTHRETTRQNYIENDDVVFGYQWLAARDSRSCIVCWMLSGKVFKTKEPFGSHVNCRCTLVPITDPADIAEIPSGAEEFKKLPEDEQRDILGNSKFEAWKNKGLELNHLVGYRKHPQFGPIRWERGLKDAFKGGMAGAIPQPFDDWRLKKRKPKPEPELVPPAVEHPDVTKPPPPPPPPAPLTGPEARAKLVEVNKHYEDQEKVLQGRVDEHMEKLLEVQRRLPIRRYSLTTDEERRLFDEKKQEVEAEADIARGKLRAAQKERNAWIESKTEAFIKVMEVETPAQFPVNLKAVKNPEKRASLQKGIDVFKRLVSLQSVNNQTCVFATTKKTRSFYDLPKTKRVTISESDNSLDTVCHEMGHWLEEWDSGHFQKVLDWYAERTKGEPLRSLRKLTGKNFRADEMTYVDKFMELYMGKLYETTYGTPFTLGSGMKSKIYATELSSMAIEMMVKDPIKFAKEDPEMFDFFYDLFRGRR